MASFTTTLLRELPRQGFKIKLGTKHVKILDSSGRQVTVVSRGSGSGNEDGGYRGGANLLAHLRRAGFQWPPPDVPAQKLLGLEPTPLGVKVTLPGADGDSEENRVAAGVDAYRIEQGETLSDPLAMAPAAKARAQVQLHPAIQTLKKAMEQRNDDVVEVARLTGCAVNAINSWLKGGKPNGANLDKIDRYTRGVHMVNVSKPKRALKNVRPIGDLLILVDRGKATGATPKVMAERAGIQPLSLYPSTLAKSTQVFKPKYDMVLAAVEALEAEAKGGTAPAPAPVAEAPVAPVEAPQEVSRLGGHKVPVARLEDVLRRGERFMKRRALAERAGVNPSTISPSALSAPKRTHVYGATYDRLLAVVLELEDASLPDSIFVDRAENFHPYECGGHCKHCERRVTEDHDPTTCALCEPPPQAEVKPYIPTLERLMEYVREYQKQGLDIHLEIRV